MVGQVGLDLPANKRYPDGSVPRRWDECAAVIQAFFRKYQPPTLIVWGKNDFIFPPEGAKCSRRPETCGDASTGHTRGGAPSAASALTLAGSAAHNLDKGHSPPSNGKAEAPIAQAKRVRMSISEMSVRCTGQRFAISSNRSRCSPLSGPTRLISRSIRSSIPSLVSHSAQSAAWIWPGWSHRSRARAATASAGHTS